MNTGVETSFQINDFLVTLLTHFIVFLGGDLSQALLSY